MNRELRTANCYIVNRENGGAWRAPVFPILDLTIYDSRFTEQW
jgi:hypothetical protein